jgi:hypothetical protein
VLGEDQKLIDAYKTFYCNYALGVAGTSKAAVYKQGVKQEMM